MRRGELSARSGVPLSTEKRIERKRGPASGKHNTVDALRAAPEQAGVKFTTGDQPGVRLAPSSKLPYTEN